MIRLRAGYVALSLAAAPMLWPAWLVARDNLAGAAHDAAYQWGLTGLIDLCLVAGAPFLLVGTMLLLGAEDRAPFVLRQLGLWLTVVAVMFAVDPVLYRVFGQKRLGVVAVTVVQSLLLIAAVALPFRWTASARRFQRRAATD